MVWGYIRSTGMGFLTNIDDRLNGDTYIDMFGNYCMIPSVHLLSLPGTWIFMCPTPYHTIYSCNA